MGLSFSGHWQHLKDKYKMKKKHSEGEPVDVYWVLKKADIPKGLAFAQDQRDKQHYLLTVTKPMLVDNLAKKLSWVADRMTRIVEGGRFL